MSNDLANFRAWYSNILAGLYGSRDAGLAIFALSFPLAERLLRQRAGLGADADLNDTFMRNLCALFPALRDAQTARQFWHVFRNGFLHQATLSRVTRKGASLPHGELTHDMSDPVVVERDGSFRVHPELFSKRVVSEIESDFATFVGAGTSAPPLPHTVVQVGAPSGIVIPPATISTRGG